MSSSFEVSVDSERKILRLKVWGFWSLEEAVRYRSVMSEAMDTLSGDSWDVLADVRRFPIQQPQVQTIHRDLMKQAVLMGMARSANIVGGNLTRVQIERLSSSAWPEKGRFRYFNTEEEADAWLKESYSGTPERLDFQFIQTI